MQAALSLECIDGLQELLRTLGIAGGLVSDEERQHARAWLWSHAATCLHSPLLAEGASAQLIGGFKDILDAHGCAPLLTVPYTRRPAGVWHSCQFHQLSVVPGNH